LSEIHVAAEHALKQTISDPDFMTSLSSLEEFEVVHSCTSQFFLKQWQEFCLSTKAK
jgi:hypothetical protein